MPTNKEVKQLLMQIKKEVLVDLMVDYYGTPGCDTCKYEDHWEKQEPCSICCYGTHGHITNPLRWEVADKVRDPDFKL